MQLGDESLLTYIYSLRPVRLTCDFYREYYAYNILLFEVFELGIQTIALQVRSGERGGGDIMFTTVVGV